MILTRILASTTSSAPTLTPTPHPASPNANPQPFPPRPSLMRTHALSKRPEPGRRSTRQRRAGPRQTKRGALDGPPPLLPPSLCRRRHRRRHRQRRQRHPRHRCRRRQHHPCPVAGSATGSVSRGTALASHVRHRALPGRRSAVPPSSPPSALETTPCAPSAARSSASALPLPAQARSPSLSAVAAWAGCPCRRSTSARHR